MSSFLVLYNTLYFIPGKPQLATNHRSKANNSGRLYTADTYPTCRGA